MARTAIIPAMSTGLVPVVMMARNELQDLEYNFFPTKATEHGQFFVSIIDRGVDRLSFRNNTLALITISRETGIGMLCAVEDTGAYQIHDYNHKKLGFQYR